MQQLMCVDNIWYKQMNNELQTV